MASDVALQGSGLCLAFNWVIFCQNELSADFGFRQQQSGISMILIYCDLFSFRKYF